MAVGCSDVAYSDVAYSEVDSTIRSVINNHIYIWVTCEHISDSGSFVYSSTIV